VGGGRPGWPWPGRYHTYRTTSSGCDNSQQINDIKIYRRTVGNIFFQTVSFVNSFVKVIFFIYPQIHQCTDKIC